MTNFLRSLVAVFVLSMFPFAAQAADPENTLVISLKDGDVTIALRHRYQEQLARARGADDVIVWPRSAGHARRYDDIAARVKGRRVPAAFGNGRLSTLPDDSIDADAVLTLPHLTGRHVDDFVAHIQKFLDQGVPIGGIGVQGHLHGDSFDPVALQQSLDKLAQFKLPVRVTEFNFPGQRSKHYGNRRARLTDEDLLAEVGRKRGAILGKGKVNLQKAAEIVIYEFRAASLGRVTLETPEEFAVWVAEAQAADALRLSKKQKKEQRKAPRAADPD